MRYFILTVFDDRNIIYFKQYYVDTKLQNSQNVSLSERWMDIIFIKYDYTIVSHITFEFLSRKFNCLNCLYQSPKENDRNWMSHFDYLLLHLLKHTLKYCHFITTTFANMSTG